MNKKAVKYLITLLAGFLTAGLVAYSKDIFSQTDPLKIFHILTDSFCVPGVVITGIGSLVFVSNEGGFDAISYGLTSFFDIFRKERKNKYRTFYDYKQEKAQKQTPCGFILICGFVFLAIMTVMFLLYKKYE